MTASHTSAMHRFSGFKLLECGKTGVNLVEDPGRPDCPLTLYIRAELTSVFRDPLTRVMGCTFVVEPTGALAAVQDWAAHSACVASRQSGRHVLVQAHIPFKNVRVRGLTTVGMEASNSMTFENPPLAVFLKARIGYTVGGLVFVFAPPGSKDPDGSPAMHWVSQRKTAGRALSKVLRPLLRPAYVSPLWVSPSTPLEPPQPKRRRLAEAPPLPSPPASPASSIMSDLPLPPLPTDAEAASAAVAAIANMFPPTPPPTPPSTIPPPPPPPTAAESAAARAASFAASSAAGYGVAYPSIEMDLPPITPPPGTPEYSMPLAELTSLEIPETVSDWGNGIGLWT